MSHKLSDDSESANIASELGIIHLVLKFMSAHDSFLRFAGIYSISFVVLFGYESYQVSWGEHSFRNIFLKILEIHLD